MGEALWGLRVWGAQEGGAGGSSGGRGWGLRGRGWEPPGQEGRLSGWTPTRAGLAAGGRPSFQASEHGAHTLPLQPGCWGTASGLAEWLGDVVFSLPPGWQPTSVIARRGFGHPLGCGL